LFLYTCTNCVSSTLQFPRFCVSWSTVGFSATTYYTYVSTVLTVHRFVLLRCLVTAIPAFCSFCCYRSAFRCTVFLFLPAINFIPFSILLHIEFVLFYSFSAHHSCLPFSTFLRFLCRFLYRFSHTTYSAFLLFTFRFSSFSASASLRSVSFLRVLDFTITTIPAVIPDAFLRFTAVFVSFRFYRQVLPAVCSAILRFCRH